MPSVWIIPPELDCPVPRTIIGRYPKDPTMRLTGLALILTIFPVIGIAFLAVYLSLHHWKTQGQVTNAIIEQALPVEEHDANNRKRSHWICVLNYSFTTLNGATFHGEGRTQLINGCQEEIGKIISIRYRLKNPEQNIQSSSLAGSEQQLTFMAFFVAILASFTILRSAGPYWWLLWKERRLLMRGVPTAGTISESCLLRRRGLPYLKIWCRYSRQDGYTRTIQRTFSLFGQTDQVTHILQKLQTNTTVLYDPANPWSAALYPLEIFKIQEIAPATSNTDASKRG